MKEGKTQAHEKCVCVFLGCAPGGARFCRLEDILDSRPFCFRKTSGEAEEKTGISVIDLTRSHSHRTMKQYGRLGFGPIRGRTAGTERRKDTFPAEICTEEAERCSL